MRKFTLFFWIIFITAASLYSQQVDKHYLFPEFKTADIHFNSGSILSVKMNYNIVFRQMLYQNENNILALSKEDIAGISKIQIGDRTFIPFEKGICELISANPYIVAEYGSMVKPEAIDMGRGATTSTAAASRISHIISGTGNFQELKNLNISDADLTMSYYIKVNDQLKKVRNIKQLIKSYPKHKNRIEEYLSTQPDFNFKNPDDFKMRYYFIQKLM